MIGILLLMAWTFAGGQSFEVASVRPASGTDAGERAGQSGITTGPDRLSAHHTSLLDCIQWAYDVREYQVLGPDWLGAERYDIAAKSGGPVERSQMRLMLQSLLAERFGLSLHRVSKELAGLVVLTAKGGPKMSLSAAGDEPGWRRVGPGLRLVFTAQTVADLASFLSTLAAVDRPVVDGIRSGQRYTFTLDLNEAVAPGDAARPSISTVLQEQLGLRLEGRRVQFDVLAIDHVEKPR